MSIFKKMLGYPAEETSQVDYTKSESNELARDMIEFVKVESAEEVLSLADKLLGGYPLVINFQEVPVSEANQIISFLSGIIYAKGGVNSSMQPKVFLFALDSVLEDGSVLEFYEEYKEVE